MIQLKFDNINKLYDELERKVDGIEELMSQTTKTQIAKAAFTITAKKLLKDFAVIAASNPESYAHMYEWESVGNNKNKLFMIKRDSVSRGNLKVGFRFLKSKTPVPVPNALKVPNRRGKSVSRRSVFSDKAEIMEAGRPVTIKARRHLAFLSVRNNDIVFIPPGRIVRIMSPGGRKAKGSFERYVVRWYSKNLNSAIDSSGLISSLQTSVTRALNTNNTGKRAAQQAIFMVTEKYSQGATEL